MAEQANRLLNSSSIMLACAFLAGLWFLRSDQLANGVLAGALILHALMRQPGLNSPFDCSIADASAPGLADPLQ